MPIPSQTTRPLKTTILVVDDDKDDQLLLGTAFRHVQPTLQLIYMDNGQRALTYLQHCPSTPALIITDMHMPILNGSELISCLRRLPSLRSVPTVVLSSLFNQGDQQWCLQAGASAYLPKPAHYTDQLQLVQGLITRWLPSGHYLVTE